MTYLDIEKLERAGAQRAPFEYVTVPAFVSGSSLAAVNRDFPKLEKAGNFPLEELDYGPGFAAFIEEIRGPEFRKAVEKKFNMRLEGLEARITVRGFADQSDGEIHTDIRSKVVTGLIYLNESWESDGGRLRLLRNARDIEDYIAEVPPVGGTLLMFKRSDNSWHGHKPFSGVRRTIQVNWIDDGAGKTMRGVGLWGRRVRRAWSRLSGKPRGPGT
ncbi:MAG: 2OG-Fe(II) oxygenase [Bradyrhizobium sp.]